MGLAEVQLVVDRRLALQVSGVAGIEGNAHRHRKLAKGGRDDIMIIAFRLGNGAYPGRKPKPLKRFISRLLDRFDRFAPM
jgi:hypothetical protein